MIKPGMLYWYSSSVFKSDIIFMLVKIRKLAKKEKNAWGGLSETSRYEHLLLGKNGKVTPITSEMKDLEEDPYWGSFFRKVEE
jgi:hypothetical protein